MLTNAMFWLGVFSAVLLILLFAAVVCGRRCAAARYSGRLVTIRLPLPDPSLTQCPTCESTDQNNHGYIGVGPSVADSGGYCIDPRFHIDRLIQRTLEAQGGRDDA